MNRAIAIDGPAASGKSSAAKLLSKELGLVMVNSGAMFRAVTWKVLKAGISVKDVDAILELKAAESLECGVDPSGYFSTVGFDGVLLVNELREEAVNASVSEISKIPELRNVLMNKQREYLSTHDVVIEGRDIGTVIFPETPFKFFFKASESIRQARREAEGIHDSIAERDKQDSSRKTAPLIPADDAVIINTEGYDLKGVVAKVKEDLVRLGW